MKNYTKYRIQEYRGVFTIQIYTYEEHGMLWWKRKVWDWYDTNLRGSRRMSHIMFGSHSSNYMVDRIVDPIKTFSTLKEAKRQIEEWESDVIYHYKEFTKEQFEEFVDEIIPQHLFHVTPNDIDDETGVRLDELILIGLLNQNPEALRHRNLAWFVEHFITNAYL